jgi:uncharacterized repeat protein (TIGR01451 family)
VGPARAWVGAWRGGLLAGLLLVAAPALAQPYDVNWHTVDGGGAQGLTAGPYGLAGTAGQPDASLGHVGGLYVVAGGFWVAFIPSGGGGQADLAITKTDGQTTAVPGQAVAYTITVTNNGPEAAAGALVTDAVPAGSGSLGWTCTASAGSTCAPSGTGGINDTVSVLQGGTLTYTFQVLPDPTLTGDFVNTASVGGGSLPDPDPGNNSATDTDALTPQADLQLQVTDLPDPVAPGGALGYELRVRNQGPSASPGLTLTNTLPPAAAFDYADAPECSEAGGVVTCPFPGVVMLPSAESVVLMRAIVDPSASGTITATATVAGDAPDPLPGNDSADAPTLVKRVAGAELVHGSKIAANLAAVVPGLIPDEEDPYRIHQAAYGSYEVIVDGTSGDIGTGAGPFVELVASDGVTVLQGSLPAGAGSSRSLRIENPAGAPVDDQWVRVRSAGCTFCAPSDVYRLRSYDTTYKISRFNNSATQITVLVIQNPTGDPVAGHAQFWNAAGTLLASQPFSVPGHGVFTVNTSTISGLSGHSGSVTLSHNAPYGALSGKAVAVEPATGFTFDTPMLPRER